MELQLKLNTINNYPIGALLLAGSDIEVWISELERMCISLSHIKLFPIPDITANSVFACLVLGDLPKNLDLGKNENLQGINDSLFIPERTDIFPKLDKDEILELLKDKKYLWHPVPGFVALESPLVIASYIVLPTKEEVAYKIPLPSLPIPQEVKSFMIVSPPAEKVLEEMEKNIFPEQKTMKDESLSSTEKIKLSLYKLLFNSNKNGEGSSSIEQSKFAEMLARFLPKKSPLFIEKMAQDFEDLERRNQKQVDKLLDLFKNNIDEALKYAIPIDENGSARGSNAGLLNFGRLRSDFSLWGTNSSGGGSAALADDTMWQLRNQYRQTAITLIANSEFEKAAFIYMKLLKDYNLAADALKKGKLYKEAATVYLKYCENKNEAAACYEEGYMHAEAIDLYKELNQFEKVADIYARTNQKEQAIVFYNKKVSELISYNEYLKASEIQRFKIQDEEAAQLTLRNGWRNNIDAYNCLATYLDCISDIDSRKTKIDTIYLNEVVDSNRTTFFRVLKHEYSKQTELSAHIKDISYEIIVVQLAKDVKMIEELRYFESADVEIKKDITKWKRRNL